MKRALASACALALAAAARIAGSAEPPAAAAPPPPVTALRGVYLKQTSASEPRGPGPLVGRVAVKYKDQTVPLDQGFREGDEIKLEVSANQPGWVFVFHRGPTGGAQLLWPAQGRPADNQLVAERARIVPDDGTIAFDRDIGQETFFVVISPVPDRPDIDPGGPPPAGGVASPARRNPGAKATRPASPVPPAAEPPMRKQILVRSPLRQMQADLDAGVRGVSFRPSGGDRYVYFSVDAKGATRWAIARFQLQHAAVAAP